MEPGGLEIMVEEGSDAAVVSVRGYVDASTAPSLRARLDDCSPDLSLRIDLSGVDFMDSSGIGVLIGQRKRWAVSGRPFVVVDAQPAVQRVLEVTGVDELFAETPSPTEQP